MAARRPFWKWHRWKSIGFCLWPPSTCIWNLKLKFQSKLDLCSGNHVVYRQTDGQRDWLGESSIPPPTSLGRGIMIFLNLPGANELQQNAWVNTGSNNSKNSHLKWSFIDFMTPGHYLNQNWLHVSDVLWQIPESNFMSNAPKTTPCNEFGNHTFNPLRAIFFRENINICLHFLSFLHTNKTQVVEIPRWVRQGPAYST